MTKASDTQVGGDHYKQLGDFQPWDVLSKWLTPEEYRGYQKGVAIAYLARERSKGGDQDIRKAVHHLQRLVEELDAVAATEQVDPFPIIDQPTDGAQCCGQPNTCENPCFHVGQPSFEVCCGRFEECSRPCVPRVRQQADAEGWIKWQGGTRPVPDTTPVQYVLRNGDSSTMMAGRLAWNHRGSESDIIAYRIINPTT